MAFLVRTLSPRRLSPAAEDAALDELETLSTEAQVVFAGYLRAFLLLGACLGLALGVVVSLAFALVVAS